MTAQNAAVQKQKMHQRITEVHLLTAKIEQDPHLQFLILASITYQSGSDLIIPIVPRGQLL